MCDLRTKRPGECATLADVPAVALLALLALLGGCLATVPAAKERAAAPAEVAAIYRESAERYLSDARESLAKARASGGGAALAHLSQAWTAFELAWERTTISGDVAAMSEVPLAVVTANTGNIPSGIDDGITLFHSLMKQLRNDDEARQQSGFLSMTAELEGWASRPIDSFDTLKRAFAIQLELWHLAGEEREAEGALPGGIAGEAGRPHAKLLRLLEQAEAPPLRDQVPFNWAKAAAASLRESGR